MILNFKQTLKWEKWYWNICTFEIEMDKKLEPQNIEFQIVDGNGESEGEELRKEKREKTCIIWYYQMKYEMWCGCLIGCRIRILSIMHTFKPNVCQPEKWYEWEKRETHIYRTERRNPFSGEKRRQSKDGLVYFSSIFCLFSPNICFDYYYFDVRCSTKSSHIDIIHFSIFLLFVSYLLISLSHITHVNS